MMKTKKVGAFLSGMMIGSTVGATVALLFAPQAGEDTRTLIRDRSIELKDMAIERGDDIRQRTEEFVVDTRQKIEEQAADIQHRSTEFVEEQRSRLQKVIKRGKQAELVTNGKPEKTPAA